MKHYLIYPKAVKMMCSRLYRKIGLFLAVAVMVTGCFSFTDVWIERNSVDESQTYLLRVLQTPEFGLETQTLNYLSNHMLMNDFLENPKTLVRILWDKFEKDRTPSLLAILSDVCINAGRRYSREEAVPFNISTCLYSGIYVSRYLNNLSGAESAANPEGFLVIRRYNAALTMLFEHLNDRKLLLNDSYVFQTVLGEPVRFKAPVMDLPFDIQHIESFTPCQNFSIHNLTHFSYWFGIGVPLVAESDGRHSPLKNARLMDGLAYPVTVLLKIGQDPDHEGYEANLRFSSPDMINAFSLGSQRFPLEKDFSTPLAYTLTQPDYLGLLEYMLNPDAGKKLQGLYLIDSYDPKKIPIVFVHGLMSSGKTWAQMINTLKNDPDIRAHYQFWFYTYSSGTPILHSARDLRSKLRGCYQEAIENGSEEPFSKMVVVGHSMGGLLSKTTITESYNFFDVLLGDGSLEEITTGLSYENKELIRDTLRFAPLPFVSRMVFIAVPHRGSEMAKWNIALLGSSLIKLPADIVAVTQKTVRKITRNRNPVVIGTGIDNLSPDNAVLRIESTLPFKKDFPYHSIIGNVNNSPDTLHSSDGVVPYWSSHLEGAESECLVHSGHSVHTHPLAIQELKRILLEHLQKNGIAVQREQVK